MDLTIVALLHSHLLRHGVGRHAADARTGGSFRFYGIVVEERAAWRLR